MTSTAKKIDPNFFVPPNVIGLEQAEPIDYSTATDSAIYDITPTDGSIEITNPTSTSALQPPSTVTIYSQTISVGPDGMALVDVILDIVDVPGATSYDIRISQ